LNSTATPLQCSLGQDEFAKAGGLQSVHLTLMTDVEHTLFAKQLLAVQRPNAISSAR
jgi:hypothetical protein